jgi:hypothetical protein
MTEDLREIPGMENTWKPHGKNVNYTYTLENSYGVQMNSHRHIYITEL